MFLAVLNKSTRFSQDDTAAAVSACAAQLKLHVAPLWDMVPASVVLYDDEAKVPAGADMLVILDNSDQAGALGYHAETPDGQPYGRAFVSPILDHGGSPLTGEPTVSAVVSHEVCEWFADRFLNLWAEGPDGQYPVEICDPVQDAGYELNGVTVSNFVTKRYFDKSAPDQTQFDYLGQLVAPFSISDGGYLLVRQGLNPIERVGASYPTWKRQTIDFPAARTFKRRAAASH